MTSATSLPRPSDRWIPWYFVAFFAVITVCLSIMAYLAVHTFSGLITDNAYDKGIAYNKSIQANAQQEALGWHGDLSIASAIGSDEINADFVLRDSHNTLLDHAQVMLTLLRPTQNGIDQKAELKVQPNGHYGATLKIPAHGLWEARIAVLEQDQNYQLTKRVVVP